jgi:hypothetical protein
MAKAKLTIEQKIAALDKKKEALQISKDIAALRAKQKALRK